MTTKFLALIAAALTITVLPAAAAPKPVKLSKHQLSKVKVGKKSVQCGLVGPKWSVVKKSGGKYLIDPRAKAVDKKACAQLLGKGKLSSLGKIPSASTMAKARTGAKSQIFGALDTSGTPPVLSEIPSMDISTLFWRPDVVDSIVNNTATQNQCLEFYGGLGTDGVSGGFPACYISQGIGFSFQTILSGGTSLCYMKKAPTEANVAGGAVSLVSGQLPDGGVAALFTPPTGSTSRLVKIIPTNMPTQGPGDGYEQEIFITVYGENSLAGSGDHYRADLVFCRAGETAPMAVQEMRVKLTGQFVSTEFGNHGEGNFRNSLSAFLKGASQGVQFDSARPRSAASSFSNGENAFKSSITLRADDIIIAKTYDSFGNDARKAVAVAHFSGSDMSNFRYDQAAYKHVMQQRSESSVIEYRAPYYLIGEDSDTANGVDLLDVRDDISFTTDSFFQSLDVGPFDTSGYNCAGTPDVAVSMDFGNPLIAAIAEVCEADRLEGMDFCRNNEAVQAAEQNFPQACMLGPQ